MSDLPPGFELESDGLPEGFQLEESPTPLNAARAPEQQPITNLGLAVVDSALSPNVMPGPAVDERPVVTNPLVAGYEALKTYPAQLRKGLAAVQMASGGLDPFEIGAAYEQAAQQGRPIDEVIAGRKLLRDTELLGERGDANREIERLRPRTEPWSPAGITSTIVESAPTYGAGLVSGVTAGPGAGLAVMSGLVGSDKFAERKAVGDSDLAATGAGLYAAAAEAAGEVIPLGRVLKEIKGLGKPFVQSGAFLEGNPLGRIIKQAGLEGSGEIVTEALNTLYDMGVLGETATAAEIIDRLAYAGVVGGAMGGTIQGGIEAVRPFVGRGGSAAAPPPAGTGVPPPATNAPPPPAGATPAAAPATNSPAPPATNAPPPPPTAAPPVPPTAAPSVAPLDQGGVDLENFGGEPLPADIVREQFITEQGLTQQDDGSFVTADGALLDPESTATLQNFLAEADEAAAVLEEQGAPVTPETVRRELQNRQRVRDLEAERAAVRTPEAQAVIDQQIAAAQQPAGGPVAELQTVADKAKERGDAQTAKAAQDAIKNLQEPTDGAVADRGSEGGRAELGRGEADAGRAGREPAQGQGAESAGAAAPAAGPNLAVEGGAGEQAGSLTEPESTAVAVPDAAVAVPPDGSSKPAPVPVSSKAPRRGVIGDKLAAGEVVTTVTGRQTTPFPKIDTSTDRKAGNTIKRVDEWLMQNALAEAEARGDEFNALSFRQDLKNPPPASKDSAELYLFGDEIPPVIPSVLKPLVPPAEPKKIEYTTPKGYTTKITIIPPQPDRAENAKDRDKWTVRSSTKAGSVVVPTQTSTFDTEAQALEFAERQRAKDMGEAPKTAPEHSAYPTEGASKEDLQGIVAEFNEAQQRQREAGEKVTHIFDAPAKGDVVRLQDKVRVQVGDSGWLTVEQAKAKVAEWKAHAKAQGENPKSRSANADKVVLSLFDLSGEWSQPWVDAGYQVYRFDIQDDPEIGDVTKFSADSFMDTFSAFEGMDVHAILAACPCTDFAVSGARHFAAKDADGRTISSVKLVQQTLATIEFFKPSVWAIENPVGRIEALTGLPPWRLSFDPNHLGDPYTKKTLLWGRFDANLPIAPVEPTEGSKMHRLYGGKSQATKNARSVTPEGFAYAFFMANNAIDNPLLAVAGKYDRLDRDAIKGALDAGLTPAQIGELVDDLYYMELDDEAANAALREAAKPPPGAPRTDEGSKPQAAEPAAEKPSEKPATLADQLASMSDADLEALIDEIAHETAAAETEKPKATRSAKTKPPKAATGAKQAAPKLRKGRATVEKATKPADVDRTAGEIAKSLSVNLSSAGQNALTGLTKLFGTSGKVSSGLTFDEDTYKQAKPYFQALLRDFQAAGKDIRDLIRELLNMLGTGAKPYILRFAQDLRSGNTEASNEQGTVRGEDSSQPDGLAPDADQRAEGERGVRGDGAGEGQAGAGAASGADEPGVSGARGRGSRQQRDRQSAAGSRRGSGAVGEGGAGASGAGVSSDPVTPAATNIPAVNFEIADDLRLGRGGEVEKFDDNIKAIETLKRIEAENRRATADEQKLLARYVGWGGLANAFPDPVSGEWKDKWKERGPRLRDLLSKAEYTAARRSTRNAHYTSEPIVRGMWRAARRLGFRGGLALESSMGVGNFVGLKPADLPAKFIGIEYDSLTARMGAALYPQATVLHAGFQSVPLPESTFALSIGNPPFGSESLRFQYKPELNRLSIHNQFFVGALDAVRPDGLHIAVVSRFLLDAQDTAARLMLAERGELVAAIRLPDTAFKENARTEVVTDIIILKRRDPADQETMKFAIEAFRQKPERDPDAERERQALAARVPEWVQTTEIPDPLGGEPMRVNNYFKANPKNIIGVMERSGSMQHGADITVRLDDAASLEQRLNEIVDRLPEKISNIGQEVLDTTEERYTLLSDALKIAVSGEEVGHVKLENDGTLSRVLEREGPDGSLLMTKQVLSAESPFSDQLAMDEKGRWYRNEVVLDEKGATVKVTGKDGKPTKRNLYQRRVFEKDSEVPLTLRLGKTGFAKLKALAGMRDLLKAQLVLETEDAATSVMEANRKKLAKAYEAFVSEYGPINRANTLSLAMTMPDGGLIAALEVRYQPARSKAQADRSGLPEQEEEAKSAPILRERVVPKYEPPTSAATAADALAIVLAERGVVDIERIAQLRSISVDEAIEELQKGEKPLVYQDPETQQWETRDAYLSGQVRRKLEAARNAGLEKNIAALEAIQPEPWGAENVTVKMGATWVPPAVYAQFVESLMDGNARVSFSAATNSFDVSVSDANESKRGDWGTQRAPAEWIIGRMLNSMAPTVYDTDSDGKTHLNQEETQLAQLKAREIGNAFDDWIFSETDRRNMLVDLFNEKYNTRVSRQFDGSHLTLPGKVPDSIISMRRHQKNAIWRGISTKTLLLDHVVGAGKTFTGIARAMERRRMGISRKPAIVVPNHLVEQWASDIYRLYPAAKVLAAGKKDFEAKNRRKLFGKIATGDWDVVVIPHSSFGFIGISPDTELRYLESQMAQAQAAIEEAWEAARENGQAEGRRKPFNVKQAERLAETLQSRMDKLREGTRDKLLTYEQLGIDDLTVDEAHEFKNLFYSSRLTGVRGMGNPTGSRKAADLYNKVRATRDMGGSVTFMTGTPVSNSAVELYTMMRYLAPEALEELGITHFDAWRAQYVDASPAFEPTETGRLKQVTRMGRQWENMRSLMDLYYSFADAVTIEDIKAAFAEDNPGKEFPVPKLKGGDRKLVKIEPTEAQVEVLNEIIAGFDGLDNIQDPRERNATRLRLMDRARKVSLDVRAVNPNSTSTEKGGKLETVANEVKRIYDASTERRGTQLIFLDRSVPKSKGDDAVLKKYDELVERQEKALREGDEVTLQVVNEELEKFDSTEIEELRAAQNGGWNAYQQIKDNLVALGIPAGEIRFIQEANTDEQKDALFDAVRGGKVRVLLGSTPRMGAGTNVQDRLVAEHHVDVTWKPSDIEQREGRIIRQGNLFVMPDLNGKPNPLYDPLFEIEIQAYATLRTVDSKMWSLNATKLKTINGLRKYDGSFSMQIDDDESVSMAEMAAEASGNPLLLERVKLESEINDLELQQRSHRRKVMAQEDAISYAKRVIAEYPKRIEETKAKAAQAEKRVSAVMDRIKELKVEVEGKTYTRLPDAQKAAFDAIQDQQAGDERAKYAVAVNGKRYTNKQDIADALGEALGDAEPFEMTIGDKTYYQRTGAARAIRERVLQAAANLQERWEGKTKSAGGTTSADRDMTITLGSAFGYELVADVEKLKAGAFKVNFALSDNGKTISAAYGPDFLPSDKGALSIQALRPAVGGIFEIYSRNANDSSASMLEGTLESARERLPELEAKPVPTFPKAEELAGKIARLKQVIAELSGTAVAPPADEPSFSRGAGTGAASPAVVARVESMVKAITAAWANPPKAVVVASMQDPKVPEAVRRADAAQKAGGATGEPLGWIIGGTIYVNAGAANTAEKVIRTVNHEALGHFGLRAAFGSRLDEELKKVALLRAKDIKAKMAEYGMADTSRNRLRAAEEVLARMAEENPQLPLVQRVLAAIRSFLRPIFKSLGVELKLTDAEIIRDYLMPARDFVRRGAGGQATAGVPAFSRDAEGDAPTIYDIGFTLPNGARYARVTRDASGERYDYFDTREAAEQAGPRSGRGAQISSRLGAAQLAGAAAEPVRGAEGPSAADRLAVKVRSGQIYSFATVEQARQADSSGAFKKNAERIGFCYRLSALAAIDGLGDVLIGRANSGYKRIWHAVVRLADGSIYDPVDRAKYAPGVYEAMFEFAPVQALTPATVRGFSNPDENLFPNPETLGFEDVDTIDFNRGPAAPASWQAPDKSLLDDFIHTLQDKNVDLRRIMQVMRQNGAQIADGQDTYTVEELNTSRKAAQIKAFVDDEVSPILKQMNVEGVTVEELEEYLHARHAPEANQRIADINPNDPNMQDGGSGMLTQDALDYMNNLPANKARSLGRLARMIDDINAGTRQILVDSGLETQATIDEWEATYAHYVPLQREGFEDQAGRGGGQGVSVRGSSVKSRMGSKRAVVDILANVVMQRERVITRAENNRVAQSLLGLAITNPNPDFWLPVNPDVKGSPARSRKLKRELIAMGLTPQDADGVAREPLQRFYNQQTGLVETRLNPALRSRDNVIAVRVNGKDRFVFFKESDPRAMRMVAALKNLDARDMGRFMRMMSTVTRYFAAVNTQYNIIFGQVNFLRDVQAALLNLGSTAIAGKGAEVAKEAARLYRATRGGLGTMSKLTGADAALWERFKAAGGTTGFRDVFPTTTARTTAIKREIDPTWWTKTPWGKVLTVNGALKVPEEQARQWVSHAFRWISDYNEALENITRMAAFKIALDSGSTEQQAASIAKNMTTNFNRRGQWSQQMGAFYAFFNAGVQGTARIVQAVTKLENGQISLTTFGKRVIAGGIGLGVIQALALAAAGATDDDPPEFVRERNLILPDFVFGTGAYFSVPMPLGWHVLPNIGRKITELALRGGERPAEAVFDLMRITLDAFNPLGSGTMSQTLTPTIVDPIAALESNKDWTGSKIAREDFNSLDPTPGFTRGKDNASVVGEAVARMLNAATGGTDFTPGDFSPTPDQVDYLAGQIGGGVAREVIKGIDSIGTLMSGELPPPYRVPLAGRFVGTMKGETNERSRFYENLLSINVAENEARGRKGRGDDITGYLKQHPEALLKQSADRIKRDVDKLNKQRRERLAQGASAAEVRPMAEQVLQLQRLLNQQYAQAKESAKSR